MKIDNIYVIENNKFGKAIAAWAEDKRIQVTFTIQKKNDLSEIVDGVVLFHENHDFSKEDLEIEQSLDKKNIAIHKVDINGTLVATNSNFNMWLDRNRPSNLLILGDDNISENVNLDKFLKGIDGQ
ncbi:hypothetical protein CW751_05285 [Brumimicrobium salinarum]|uniref:Uncharacterized protein n=1 Tax=Brumimicrobium salinarum TaxID=2058658 RepID=A0A2I0R4I1_9FLAO|nr:hypothetical protein [Brumimicrobium salinarum]PKR81468.1 hypothetical protein CW751_05285 [Brumimicrobium salinarum]